MATKTWKIGEYCKGGVITVITEGTVVAVIGKEWDFAAGSKKSSNQSKAKEFTRLTRDRKAPRADMDLIMYLNDLTTSYYADKVMDWIKEKATK